MVSYTVSSVRKKKKPNATPFYKKTIRITKYCTN